MIGIRSLGFTAGIDSYVTEVAMRLAKKGHCITVLCRSGYVVTKNHNDIHVVAVRTIKNKYLGTPLYAFFSTIYVLTHRFDVISYHGLGSAGFSFLPRLFGRKVTVTIHALDWEGKKWSFFSRKVLCLAATMAIRFSNCTTVVSRYVKEYFENHHNRNVTYIPNGTSDAIPREPELIKEYGLKDGNYILFLGRLAPGKGCEYLMDAFGRLKLDLKLVIAGDAINEREYVESLRKMGGKNIIFTGWVQGPIKEELLSNAYLFIQPSELEGMSGVLLEAMSYGRCIVASDIPQNLEVIGETGFSFRSGDADDLKRIIEFLVENKEKARSHGNLGKERVLRCYHWDRIADEWQKTYCAVLGN
ncbi:MAG: glycosyltransferase family 4 protein [Pseudomonadota bacterium]